MMRVSKLLGKWSAGAFLILGGLLLAGCAGEPQFAEVPGMGGSATTAGGGLGGGGTTTTTAPGNPASVRDLIRPGYTLIVYINDTPQTIAPMEIPVREDGRITLLQDQDFMAAGKTLGQLGKEIRARYVPNYYPNMTALVTFKQDTRFFIVGGEVKAPGRQVYLGPIHLLGAIKSAGDFTDFANKKSVQLTRFDGHTLQINCKAALKNPALDPEVFPGDNINVPRRYNPFSF
ncbi:MAG TPA: hypothetical protein VG167_12625 [Verrucomicrobiae bacterium]|nr:hypothetical protein [Verrucomicrobiae bacterium]